jgi:MarR family transcriptional regulator, transcriptional regulator for hemolysin
MISTHTKSEGFDRKHFGYVIHDLAKKMKRCFDGEAQAHGLTLPQWRVIGQLSLNDGLSQSALAGLIEADPMTVSGLVDRLESKGLVERTSDPNDSRAKIVLITDRARAMVVEMRKVAEQVYAHAFDGIAPDERETALKVLQQMSANLDKERSLAKEEVA